MKSVSWDFTVDWRKLRLLHELDRRGTIAAVADAMYLTPSAVSQQLAGLAREVGVPLLERRGRSVVLTGQARVLLGHAEEMRGLAERTRAALDAWADGAEGYVRVGSLATGIAALVGPAIIRLREERPGLTIRVSEQEPDEALDLLDAGELEVAVTVDYPGGPAREDARYRRVDLIADVMDAVVPAGHPLAARPSVNLTELACDVWVGAAASDACGHIMTGICAAAGFSPDVQYHCREWDAVAALVAAGVGVALIPRSAQPLRPHDLAVLPVAGAPASRLLYALTRAGTEQDPATRAMLEALQAVAAARPDGLTRIPSLSDTGTGVCVALGQYHGTSGGSRPFTATLSNGSWTTAAAPLPGDAAATSQLAGLWALKCPASGTCVAGGHYLNRSGQPRYLIDTLSGGTWTASAAPLPPGAAADQKWSQDQATVIGGLGCASASFCAAPASGQGNYAYLMLATCPAPSSCLTVGSYPAEDGTLAGLVETAAPKSS